MIDKWLTAGKATKKEREREQGIVGWLKVDGQTIMTQRPCFLWVNVFGALTLAM